MLMILVTGGSGSGKSAFAEQLVVSAGVQNRIYIATMEVFDEESKKRVKRHRDMRADKNFQTVECPRNLRKIQLDGKPVVLLECLSNLTANEMFAPEEKDGSAFDRIWQGILNIKKQAETFIIVTNEIFSDYPVYEDEMKEYLETLGKLNQAIACEADQVYEVVYGIPIRHK